MSIDDQIRCISHSVPPVTPPISALWEKKTGTEQLNHLYAILIHGEWGQKAENQLFHLYVQVILSGERVDVTEEQVRHLMDKVWNNREWSSEMKRLAHQLYTKVMNVEWFDVINIYRRQKEVIQMAVITPSKQTALHIAISNSLTQVVEMLLDNIDALAIREMTDNREENPLHLAASLGQFETCKLLVEKDPELIGAQNVDGETPLFLAVLHGKKEAFYALHPKCPITGKDIKHAKAHCKRKDGNTILHVSIRGEYFELAYHIIHWYPELIKDFNEDGQTALLLLAQNPSAFRSGCYLGPVDDFIYSCLIVDSDKVESLETPSDFRGKHCLDIACPVPKNYQTCLNLLNLGKRVFKLIVSWARAWKDIKSVMCKIFSRNVDRLPMKNTIPGERQETSNRDPIQDEMSHDSCKHCQREHIDGKKRTEMMEPIGKWNELVQKVIQGNEVFVEAEELRPHVYRFKMQKDSIEDDKANIAPILVAAKMGIVEIVEEILNNYPFGLYDEDSDKKNVLMLAAENGQAHVFNLLRTKYYHMVSIYQKLDNEGNTAIHLAATFGKNRPWRISSAAIQMQWDLKWYNFIVSSMPTNLRAHRNKDGKTSVEVFEETHEGIIKDGVKWLNSTSESCSVVAALIASVAYASAATVPGGDNQNNGIPILKGEPSFDTFIIASLVALCFSVTSLTMFLSVLTSNYTIQDFLHNLPTKLLLGLTSLFISIGAMLVSFCAGHFFNIGDRNRNTGSPVFAIIFLPVSAYVLTHFRLLISLVKAPF